MTEPEIFDSRDPDYLKALCQDWAVPTEETDSQTLLAHLEVKLLEKLAAVRTRSEAARRVVAQLLASQYFTLRLRWELPILFENSRPGRKHAKSAAVFARQIQELVESLAGVIVIEKVWPALGLPLSVFDAVLDMKVKSLLASEQWYVDLWKRRAWEDERDGVRLQENWRPPKPPKSQDVGNGRVLEGHDAVSYATAQQYLGISRRGIELAVKKTKLEPVGKGQKKQITVASLLAYLPPKNKTN